MRNSNQDEEVLMTDTAAEERRAERYKELWRPAFMAAYNDPSVPELDSKAAAERALEAAAIAAAKDTTIGARTDTGTAITLSVVLMNITAWIAVYNYIVPQLPFNFVKFNWDGTLSIMTTALLASVPLIKKIAPGFGDKLASFLGQGGQQVVLFIVVAIGPGYWLASKLLELFVT